MPYNDSATSTVSLGATPAAWAESTSCSASACSLASSASLVEEHAAERSSIVAAATARIPARAWPAAIRTLPSERGRGSALRDRIERYDETGVEAIAHGG